MRLPSPSVLIALLALAVAVGGGDALARDAYTAAKKAISGKTIKKGTIEADRLSARARRTLKGARGTAGARGATGPSGAQGIQGIQGPPGTVDTSSFHTKSAADERYAPKGRVVVSAPAHSWHAADPTGVTEYRYLGSLQVSRTSTVDNQEFLLQPTLPVVQNGKRMRLESLRYCYDADAATRLDRVGLFSNTPPNSGADGAPTFIVNDDTNRTDAACRTLVPPSPVELTAGTHLSLSALVDWTGAGVFLFTGIYVALVPTETDG